MKKGTHKAYMASGAQSAPEAMNTAPKVRPARSIAGYGKAKTVSRSTGTAGKGTPNPTAKKTTGMGMAGPGAPKKRMSGGPANPGHRVTQSKAGTSAPKMGKGPSGIGRTGKGAPW